LGVDPSHLLVTAGGDEATDRICRAFLCPGREIILPVPTFEMLAHYPRLAGAETIEVPWAPGQGYPLAAVLDNVSPNTGVIAVVSPNNPTGAVATANDLMKLSQAAPHALLLVDQAYAEFEQPGADDLTAAALSLPNAVVIRTVSKAWGLAGLRIGCAVGAPRIMTHLRAVGGPFTTSAPSLAVAGAVLRSGDAQAHRVQRYIAAIRREREHLARVLQAAPGADAWESQGNFVLARFDDAAAVHASLWEAGISVRRLKPIWRTFSLENFVRITCPGDLAAFDRLIGALLTALWGAEAPP
jgi:histidinol-phosphate aminotransferase